MFTPTLGQSNKGNTDTFLKKAEEARHQRLLDKQKTHAAIQIQRHYRGYRTRRIEHAKILDKLFRNLNEKEIHGPQATFTACQLYDFVNVYLFLHKFAKNSEKLATLILPRLCTHLALSIQTGDFKHSYVSLIISKTKFQEFLWQSKKLLRIVVDRLKVHVRTLKVKEDYYKFEILLNLVSALVAGGKWKCFALEKSGFVNKNEANKLIETMLSETTKSYLALLQIEGIYSLFSTCLSQHLNNHKLILTEPNLSSILTLSIQTLQSSNYAANVLNEFASEILTIPSIIKTFLTLKTLNVDIMLNECNLSCRLYPLLTNKETKSFIEGKDFLQGISFLGNLCSIELLDFESFKLNVDNFLIISTEIIEYCSGLLAGKSSGGKVESAKETIITWTPLFGYLKLKFTNSACFDELLEQLRFLWSHKFIILLFVESSSSTRTNLSSTVESATSDRTPITTNDDTTKANFKSFLKAFFDKSSTQQLQHLNSPASLGVYRICSFYKKILVLFTEPKIEVLSALSFEEEFLLGLWKYFSTIGPQCGLKELIKTLDREKSFEHPVFDVLYVLASLVLYLFTIFDEDEVFTEQKSLTKGDFRVLANFLNVFLYEVINCLVVDGSGSLTAGQLEKNQYFILFHQLLLVIYDKDCKKNTMEQMEHFYVIKSIKIKNFMNDLSRGKSSSRMILNKIPHIIPLKHRIEIMQADIMRDKEKLDFASVRIKVHRNRLIEDGIDQINCLPSLKSTVRVKMVNEFGLSEAGIDQDGVFKEFLLDVIKKILNPEFNLFQITIDQQLYPSSSSYYIEDHLKMFQFVGKLIGKAVYEGHVIDVQFAPFFLRQIIGCQQRSSNYSFLDDLASLDKELYKNLKSIKHCENVSEWDLSFAHSEMHLGQLVTHELVPNGSDIKVTDENKIRYIHLLAHHKLHKQIREQIIAFDKGFKSIIKQEWLNSFTLAEIQTLISGSIVDLDLNDLKENVQYWGGLHAQHRLIKWLWDIIESDFNHIERALFLKFVTSSSRPPLLGFSSLNPQFTIRSIENNEEDGTIYDASFKGFFKTMLNIGNDKETMRLPTSSTCFNLLKLPNYSKKSTLKERLRYAITSNSGFELS